jgi:hypothetical protein
VRVDVKAIAADESDERHSTALGEVDGEARRRGDGRDQWNPGDERFLDDFKGRPAADEEQAIAERK